jgi:hypothetical protein
MNAAVEVEKLIAALPEMASEDLRTLHAKLGFLLKVGPKGEQETATSFSAVMYSALVDQMVERTKVKYPPFGVFQKQAGYQKFAEACAVVEEANSMWFPKQTRAERVSMTALYAGLVLDRLAERGTTMVWNTINFWLGNLPALVDDAFPGYAMSGLLSKVQMLRTKRY